MDDRKPRLELAGRRSGRRAKRRFMDVVERGHGILYKRTSHAPCHTIPILPLLRPPPPPKCAFKTCVRAPRLSPPATLSVHPPFPPRVLLQIRRGQIHGRPSRTPNSALTMTDVGRLTLQCNGSEGLALATTTGRGLMGSRDVSHKQIPV